MQGSLAGVVTPGVLLKTLDFLVHRALSRADAPPFLGLLEPGDKVRKEGGPALRALIGADPARAGRVLAAFPNLAAWFLCDLVRRTYGGDGDFSVWPEIAEGLGLTSIPSPVRPKLHKVVARRCLSLGLPVPEGGWITLFQLHAGVAAAQLDHLIDAFLAQEEAEGFPPLEDGVRLNRWEDGALDHLHPTVIVPRRPILWDATAWHATLYGRCRQGDVPGHFLASVFDEKLKARQLHRRAGRGGGQARPEPRLTLDGTDLALRLPEGSERVRVSCDCGEALRLRGGQCWPLPRPLPRRIDWRLGDRVGTIMVLASEGQVLVADLDGGGSPCHVADRGELPMSRVAVFARESLSAPGLPASSFQAEQLDEGLHLAVMDLGPQDAAIRVGRRGVVLRQRLHRKLAMIEGVIADGPHGPLRGPSARLRVSTGIAEAAERWLTVALEGQGEGQAAVRTDAFGQAELGLADLLSAAGLSCSGGPATLRVELMRPAEADGARPVSSGLRLRDFVWPGWHGRIGASLGCDAPPANIVLEASDGIARDDRGHPCLVLGREGAPATLAFKIEGEVRTFRLAPGDLCLTHLLPDGSRRLLERGTSLLLDATSRAGAIRVESRDPAASLEVCGERRPRPFHAGSICTVPLRGLGPGWLRLLRLSGLVVDLVEVRAASAFESLAMTRRSGRVELQLRVPGRIDAVRVELASETGESLRGEVHFGPDAWLERPAPWLVGDYRPDGGIAVAADPATLPAGFWLGTVSVRDAAGWHPLTAPRGDAVSLALDVGSALADDLRTTERLGRVLGWLDLCHASECWHDGGVGTALTRRRDRLARELAQSPGGRARLMSLMLGETWPGEGGTWMPPLHLFDACPDLFEAVPDAFHKAGPHLSVLGRIAVGRLRENDDLDVTALLAFANAHSASRTGEPLRRFSVPRFLDNLANPTTDHDPFAGRRWPGRPLLGPGHWRAAHERLEDRLGETGMFGEDAEGRNGLRSERLLRLCPVLAESAPPVPPPLDDWRAELHARLSATLLDFARAARAAGSRAWIARRAKTAGLNEAEARGALGDLLRLAPELFAIHLIIAELERRQP